MRREDDGNEWPNPYATPHPLAAEPRPVARESAVPSDLNPFRSIWTAPRVTIRWIRAVDPEYQVLLFTCLLGIKESLDRACTRDAGDNLPLAAILGIAMVAGPIGGLISMWISSHLVRLSGSWIGGTANRTEIKAALVWGVFPVIASLPLWGLQLLLFGSEMFTSETPRLDDDPTLLMLFVGIGFVELVLAVWALVLVSNTLAEVQGFRSAWAGLGNLFLAGAVILVPFLVLATGFLLIV